MDDKLIIPASRWIPVGEDTPKEGQLILTEGTMFNEILKEMGDTEQLDPQKYE